MDEFLKQLNEINAVSQLRSDYAKTIALLRALKSGSVGLDNVTLTADGWQVSAFVPIVPAVTEQAEPGQVEPEA